jgi:hypothetical protein
MLRWLERNGYDVSYSTGVDTDRRGAELFEHRVFLSVGHDEYWSAGQRANVEAARAAGVHLGLFSGNLGFWKTRWESSIDGSGTAYRTLVCYKETQANAKIDPQPGVWTGTWRDPRFGPHDGGRPENALNGPIFMVNGIRNDTPLVPAADGKMRFWRNTTVATLAAGQTATLPTGVLGFEWDEDLDNGSRPPGLVRLSSTTISGANVLADYGSTYVWGPATHHLTLYRHSSGALVFGAGTVQWSWGLDDVHDFPGAPTDARMQQATVNLLADMQVQPATLQSGLVAATASTDTTAPTAAVTSPTNGATVETGTPVTISGTASDVGGQVGGVEVSTDGGTTWHPADGRSAWTYLWTPSAAGSATLRARTVDDSGNLGAASAGVTVTIIVKTCPCSLWSNSTVPAQPAVNDPSAVELGVKFTTDVAGVITGIRFYKGPGNTGTHTGRLWSGTGTLLGTVTFTGETSSGWQTASFASPIAVSANTTYVASYHTPAGNYAFNIDYFGSSPGSVVRPPLRAPQSSVSGGNGVYRYGAGGVFPTGTYGASNYWVDVVFVDGTGPTTTTTTSTTTTTTSTTTTTTSTTTTTTTATAQCGNGHVEAGEACDGGACCTAGCQFAGAGAVCRPAAGACDVAETCRGSSATCPANGFATNGTSCSDGNLCNGAETCQNGTCTPGTALVCNDGNVCTTDTCNPATGCVFTNNTAPCSDGVACTSDVCSGGVCTGTSTCGAGQTCNLTTGACQTAAPAASIWPATTVPTNFGGGDIPVELGVKFRSDVAGYVTAIRFYKDPRNTGTHVGNLWSTSGTRLAQATFTGETAGGWQQVSLSPPVAIAANTVYIASYLSPNGFYAISPNFFASQGVDNAPLHALASGVSGPNGVFTYNATSTFPTSSYANSNYWVDVVFSAVPPVQSIWSAATVPGLADGGPDSPVELGVKFRSDVAGYITGIRFYKHAANTGTHVANLWSLAGARLATATFSGETASGWQQVTFSSPVAIAANTVYVASYFCPGGHYSADLNYFASQGLDNAPLHALATGATGGPNGVFAYGPTSTFPNQTWFAGNYWVDVMFSTTPP